MNREDLDACTRRVDCPADAHAHLTGCPANPNSLATVDLLGQLQGAVDRARADRHGDERGSGRIGDMLDQLVEAAILAIWPQPIFYMSRASDDHRRRLRPALGAALRATVRDDGGQEIDGQRLTPEACRASALKMLDGDLPNNPGQREKIVTLVAQLLQSVREADQRERWIREGYSASSRAAEARAAEAEQRVGELETALRLVKRATRHVTVGRE